MPSFVARTVKRTNCASTRREVARRFSLGFDRPAAWACPFDVGEASGSRVSLRDRSQFRRPGRRSWQSPGVVRLPRFSARRVLHAREDRRHAVVVALGDRVELVIVAAAHSRRSGRGTRSPVVETMSSRSSTRCWRVASPSGCRPRRARRPTRKPVADRVSRRRPGMASPASCSRDEPVERHVVVERADDPVAIRPGIGPRRVHLVAVALGEAHDVEPVPPPALAVCGRGEQPIDELLVGVRRRSRDERVDLLRGGPRPVRSKVTRRISVRRSAAGSGRRPFFCSAASTNASIGLLLRRESLEVPAGGSVAGTRVSWLASLDQLCSPGVAHPPTLRLGKPSLAASRSHPQAGDSSAAFSSPPSDAPAHSRSLYRVQQRGRFLPRLQPFGC